MQRIFLKKSIGNSSLRMERSGVKQSMNKIKQIASSLILHFSQRHKTLNFKQIELWKFTSTLPTSEITKIFTLS